MILFKSNVSWALVQKCFDRGGSIETKFLDKFLFYFGVLVTTPVYLTVVLSNCRMFCLRLTKPRLFYVFREVPEATSTLGYTFGDMLRDVPKKISLSILDEEL